MSQAQVLFFWDYDTEWGAQASRTGRKTWGMAEFVNTDRLLELYAERDLHGCFACVGAAALPGNRPFHDPDQIRRIHAAGHEVASHSYRHDWLPGLGPAALRDSLLRSREVLEACIAAPVISFVPPWNQPYDHFRVGSVSLSERREVRGRDRTDVARLCATLRDTGYRFVRLGFRHILRRVMEALPGDRAARPAKLRTMSGVRYVVLNGPAGFDARARASVHAAIERGGIAVVWGHPHSLTGQTTQSELHLVPFLDWIVELRRKGLVDIVLPRTLVTSSPVAPS